jgi:hypothetical protein
MTEMNQSNLEIRWIVLGTNGKHVTVGRDTDPTEEEVAVAEAALVARGLAGWLALMKANYYSRHKPSLSMIRALGNPTTTFDEAARAFFVEREKLVTGLQ